MPKHESKEQRKCSANRSNKDYSSAYTLTGPGHVISFHVPEDHIEVMKKQGVVMREDFGTKKHVDPFSSLLGGELLPPVLKVMQKNQDKQKSSKLIKSQKDSINELKSSPLDGSKRKNGEVHRRFNNGKNRKNKRTKNKNKANKHNRFDKSKSITATKSTSTITTSTTTKRPRRGRKEGSSKRRNISVRAWLARG